MSVPYNGNGNRIFGSRNYILEPHRWDPIELEAAEQRLRANRVRGQLAENAEVANRSLPAEAYGAGGNGDVEFDRRRDVRSECGWPDAEPSAWQYQALFNEDPLANRVVTCWPSACWQVSPSVWETDEEEVTPFEQAVDDLCKTLRGEQSMFKGDEGNPLWSVMERCHVLSRIGQYGVIYTGYDDGLDPSEPVPGAEETNSMPGEQRPDQPSDERGRQGTNGPAGQPKDKKLVSNEDGDAGEIVFNRDMAVNASPCAVDGRFRGKCPMGTDGCRARHRYGLTWNAVQDPERFAKIFDALDGKPQSGDLPDGGKEGDDAEQSPRDGDRGQPPEDGPSETGQRLKIVFVRPYAEPQARISRWETNRSSPRYNQPVMYQITTNDPRAQRSGIGPPMTTINVHWTRVTHLPCNPLSSEVLGMPAMRPVLNEILDCRKVAGASAEGYWKNGVGAVSFETHPQLGGQVDVDDDELRDMMERSENSQQKWWRLIGMSAKALVRDLKDPALFTDPRVDRICIALDFPKRIFVGSERGELASSQDDSDHNDDIKRVQNGFLTPRLIVPWFDRQIQVGALPKPAWKPKPPPLPGQPGQPGIGGQGDEPANVDDEAGDLSLDELMGDEGGQPGGKPRPAFPPRPSANAFPPPKPGGANPFAKGGGDPKPGMGQIGGPPKPGQPAAPPQAGAGQKGTLHGVKPREEPGYHVEWPDVHNADPAAKADIVNKRMTAAATYITGQVSSLIPEKNFLVDELDYTDEQAEAFVSEGELKQLQDEEKQFQQQKRLVDEGVVPDPNDPDLVPDNTFHATPAGPPGAPGAGGKPNPFAAKGPPRPGGFGAGPKKPNPFAGNAFCPTGPGGGIDPSCGKGEDPALPLGHERYADPSFAEHLRGIHEEAERNRGKASAATEKANDLSMEVDRYKGEQTPWEGSAAQHALRASTQALAWDHWGKPLPGIGDAHASAAIYHRQAAKENRKEGYPVADLHLKAARAHEKAAKYHGRTVVDNSFCPTGPGGGVDPSCSGSGSGGRLTPEAAAARSYVAVGNPAQTLRNLYDRALDADFSRDALGSALDAVGAYSKAAIVKAMEHAWGERVDPRVPKAKLVERVYLRVMDRRLAHARFNAPQGKGIGGEEVGRPPTGNAVIPEAVPEFPG